MWTKKHAGKQERLNRSGSSFIGDQGDKQCSMITTHNLSPARRKSFLEATVRGEQSKKGREDSGSGELRETSNK